MSSTGCNDLPVRAEVTRNRNLLASSVFATGISFEMHFDYAPFPLLSYPSHYEADSPTEPRFEREAFPCKVNDLCEAIAKGQVDKLKSYISSTENKADILDQNGESALHHAARINRVEVIDFLIKAGASVDIYSKDGFTPLHEAAR